MTDRAHWTHKPPLQSQSRSMAYVFCLIFQPLHCPPPSLSANRFRVRRVYAALNRVRTERVVSIVLCHIRVSVLRVSLVCTVKRISTNAHRHRARAVEHVLIIRISLPARVCQDTAVRAASLILTSVLLLRAEMVPRASIIPTRSVVPVSLDSVEFCGMRVWRVVCRVPRS